MKDDADPYLTLTGKIKQPTISLVCELLNKSWENVRTYLIVNSSKKCAISNALDGKKTIY